VVARTKKTSLGETREEGKLTELEASVLAVCAIFALFGFYWLVAWMQYKLDNNMKRERRLRGE